MSTDLIRERLVEQAAMEMAVPPRRWQVLRRLRRRWWIWRIKRRIFLAAVRDVK